MILSLIVPQKLSRSPSRNKQQATTDRAGGRQKERDEQEACRWTDAVTLLVEALRLLRLSTNQPRVTLSATSGPPNSWCNPRGKIHPAS